MPWNLTESTEAEVQGPTVTKDVTQLQLGYELVSQPGQYPSIRIHVLQGYVNGEFVALCAIAGSPFDVPPAEAAALAAVVVNGAVGPEFESVLWGHLNDNELIPDGSEV